MEMRLPWNGREGTEQHQSPNAAVMQSQSTIEALEERAGDLVGDVIGFAKLMGCTMDFSGWHEAQLAKAKVEDFVSAGATPAQGARLVARIQSRNTNHRPSDD
eukprot:c16941_g1_i2.p1 GENE.c16941_g1_i2~~c16941_g1_i2.p1  ORF type:complete len:103 (+),score=19.88 c16941_g1_i2:35-343(+)